MKSKIQVPILLLLTFSIISCKKESVSAPAKDIIGEWKNIAVYSDPAKGGHGWETVTRFHEYVIFTTDAKFTFFTDTPGSKGTYNLNELSQDLTLHFEPDQFGNSSRSETRKVEAITADKLILSFTSPVDGVIYKAEYSRN